MTEQDPFDPFEIAIEHVAQDLGFTTYWDIDWGEAGNIGFLKDGQEYEIEISYSDLFVIINHNKIDFTSKSFSKVIDAIRELLTNSV